MVSRVIIGAVVVGMAAPLWAQQSSPVPVTPEARFQVQVFERNLRAAIERGAQQLASRAREVVPNVILQFQAEPVVNGILLPEGAIFYVQIPGIEDVGLKLWAMSTRQGAPGSPNNLARVSNDPPRVGAAATLVEPDPVVPPLTDPSKEYTDFVRLALIDAMLDNSLALPVGEGQFLTLVADELAGQPADPLAQRSRKLILRIKGDDLIALRQNRIKRDEAKQRILESKY